MTIEGTQVLLIGDATVCTAVIATLEHHAGRVVVADSIAEGLRRLGAGTLAVLHVGDEPPQDALRTIRRARGAAQWPIVLLVRGVALDDARAGSLYDLGAAAVVAWPQESLMLAALLDLVLGGGVDEAGPTANPLELAVRARLESDAALRDDLQIRVLGTTAFARGVVAPAWEQQRLRRLLAATPWITRVVDHHLRVDAAPVADDALRTLADATVRSVGGAEARGVSVDVEAGQATLHGSISEPAVMTAVGNALRRVPGIRRVYDDTVLVV